MTNLDGILKSTDITLPTKVRIVKAMVFPVAMYRSESWTIKKAHCQSIEASASGSVLLYGPALTSIHRYWKKHSFDYVDLCRQGDVSAFQDAV